MSRILAGIAAVTLMGAAALPLQANAAERHQNGVANVQSDEISAQRRYYRRHYGYRHYGPRRYYGPRYGNYGPRYGYYGGYDYPYYRRPGIAFGIGPFGFRAF